MNQSIGAISRPAAYLSLVAAGAFVLLLALLHLLEPEFDPSWNFISEYTLGAYGWLMALAFGSLAVSFSACFLAIKSQLRTVVGRIGLAMLLISATSMVLAALFKTDPITTPPDAVTTSGALHNLGGSLGLAMPFAGLLVCWGLTHNPAWRAALRSLWWVTGIALASTVTFIVALVLLIPSDGMLGPDVHVGWFGRVEIVAYSVWLMVVAWQALQRSTIENGGVA
ncbi:MAG: DUF998 domain-containing protein [Caldilineaceae bacterium]